MNALIDHANINTHVKIVAVGLLAAILIVVMVSGRMSALKQF